MRLQKYLADAGIASRRSCEELIRAGQVKVNGEIAQLGCTVEQDQDIVEYQGKTIRPAQERVVLLFNKPRSVICTASDPQGRTTIYSYFHDYPCRLYSVGRLDYDSEGLLVMTNDGELANRMMHPSYELEKTYRVICDGVLTDAEKASLEQGVLLEDGMTRPARVQRVEKLQNGNTIFDIIIHEGRNRQVRRMMEKINHKTEYLCRIQIGPLQLSGLKKGGWRPLSENEKNALYALIF